MQVCLRRWLPSGQLYAFFCLSFEQSFISSPSHIPREEEENVRKMLKVVKGKGQGTGTGLVLLFLLQFTKLQLSR